MPVTRINNNQVTDASAGNTIVGINAGTKLQNYSITATKIANNLTYGSDLTVAGNLIVQGNSTAIDTTITTIEDPVIVLASTQTGAPAVDIGFIGERGSSENIAFVWDESAQEFVTAFTNTSETNTTINITGYANARVGNMIVGGTTSLAGNVIGTANFTGNVNAGNVNATGNVTAANFIGNIQGNISAPGANTQVEFNDGGTTNAVSGFTFNKTSNLVTVGGNVNAANFNGNVFGTSVSASGTVTAASTVGGVITGSSASVTGGVTAASVAGGVITGTSTSVTGTQTAASTVGGVITGSSASVTGGVTAASVAGGVITGTSTSVTGSQTAASTVGGVITGSSVSVTGNVTGANLVVSTNIYDASALNIVTGAGNLNLQPAGNIVVNNTYINGLLQPVQNQDAATKLYVDNAVTTAISYHDAVVAATTTTLATTTGGTITYAQPNGVANGVGATLTTTGSFNLIDSANVQTAGTRILVKDQANAVQNGIYVWSNATVITRSTDADIYGPASANTLSINDYFFVTSGNVNLGSAWIVDSPAGTITFGTSNILFAQFSQSQVYSANTSAGLSLIGTVFSAKVDNNTTAFDGGGNISVKAGANLTTPNIGAATGTSLSVTGTVTAASTVGGVITGSSVSVTGTATAASTVGGVITGSSASLSGNILTSSNISATGNVTAANFIGNIQGNISSPGANTQIIFNDNGLANATSGFTFNKTSNLVTVGGNVNAANFNGNVFGTTVSASGTVTAASTVGGVITGSSASVTGTVTAASTVGGVITGSTASLSGNITGANLALTSGIIDGPAAGRITINGSDIDTDFAVDGDTLANVFYVDAGTGTASFGNSTQVTNAIVSFQSTTSIRTPVGNTQQRPAVGVTGMLRFNTTTDALEVYDNDSWASVGTPVFTVIADEQFSGNGVQTQFTLGSTQTTNSCIVSINGVVQIPTLAYSVAGTNPTCVLTFTEAPASGDVIDVRQITTTTSVTSISNSSGNAVVAVSPGAANVDVTGNLVISGSVSAAGFIGLDATSIANGTSSMTVVSSGGNIRGNVGGTTVMTISPGLVDIVGNLTVSGNATLSGNILGDRVQNGTTSIDIQTPNGNANVTIGGTSNVAVFTTTGVVVTGDISLSGNITDTGAITISTGSNGNINLAPNGSGNINTGANIMPTANATANIGSATLSYNTIFAKATSAQYADLAEKYAADAGYAPGTVVMFGGPAEVTLCVNDGCSRVAGVISTNPSYRMNDGLQSEHTAMVALTGRVPTKVTGTVRKGDMMVSAGNGVARAEANPQVGTVIGKALADSEGDAVIEVVVGRV
jgi:hypothetical protein